MILDHLSDLIFAALPNWAQIGCLVVATLGILAVIAIVYFPDLLESVGA
jgi:hypothetical protein